MRVSGSVRLPNDRGQPKIQNDIPSDTPTPAGYSSAWPCHGSGQHAGARRATIRNHNNGGPHKDLPDNGRLRHVRSLPAGSTDEQAPRDRAAQSPRPPLLDNQRRRPLHPAKRHRFLAGHELRPHGIHRAQKSRRPDQAAHLPVGRVGQQAALGSAGGPAHVRGAEYIRRRVECARVHEDERQRRQRREPLRRDRGQLLERRLEAGVCGLPGQVHPVLPGI